MTAIMCAASPCDFTRARPDKDNASRSKPPRCDQRISTLGREHKVGRINKCPTSADLHETLCARGWPVDTLPRLGNSPNTCQAMAFMAQLCQTPLGLAPLTHATKSTSLHRADMASNTTLGLKSQYRQLLWPTRARSAHLRGVSNTTSLGFPLSARRRSTPSNVPKPTTQGSGL